MPTLERTAKAEEDLMDIWLYIAHDDVRAADCVLDDIEETLLLLADQPGLGPARPDIAPDFPIFRPGGLSACKPSAATGAKIVPVRLPTKGAGAIARAKGPLAGWLLNRLFSAGDWSIRRVWMTRAHHRPRNGSA